MTYTIEQRRVAGSRGGQSAKLRRRPDREAGLAWARAWRERTRPYFDALYAEERGDE